MILLLLLISVALVVLFFLLARWDAGGYDDVWDLLSLIFGVASIVFLIICIFLVHSVKTEFVIDERIAMYEEENAEIEHQIGEIVTNYMSYEQETFEKTKNNIGSDVMVNVSMFPELKSDTLVAGQMEIYAANKAKIISLREEKVELKGKKWLLYFGH